MILFIISYIIPILENLGTFNPIVMITFFCIGVLCFINLITSLNYEFSLYKIHGYFFLIFLFLAPLHQYVTKSFPWGWRIEVEIVILGNLVIIIWLVIYLLTYYFMPSSKSPGQLLPQNKMVIIIGFFLTIISTVITIYSVGGVANLFTRVGTDAPILQSISLIITTTVRPFPVLYFSYLYITLREKNNMNEFKWLRVLLLVVLLVVFITNFPTAVSRYHAAAVYIGIILLVFNKKISFDILFLIGIVIIFPTLDLFRRTSFEDVFSNFKFQIIELSTGHFDAYSMLVRTIELVINEGPSYGFQLLGVLFFFIPRSVWSTKPVGSGAYVGEALGLEFLIYLHLLLQKY